MVLCIMILLPFNLSLMVPGQKAAEEAQTEILKDPLEWEVYHLLAQSIPASYEEETLKAQAVVIRTNALLEQGENAYLLMDHYRDEWGEEFEDNCSRFLEAVKATKGMYLTVNGEAAAAPFFRVSNGNTRDGAALLGEETYSYLRQKACPRDFMAEEFLQTFSFSVKTFFQKLDGINGISVPDQEWEPEYTRDGAGYVTEFRLGDWSCGGEDLRGAFGLPSSDYELIMEGKEIQIHTKGVGHGVGLSQFAANEMAGEGADFMEILNYFFTDIAISKTE